MSDVDIDRALHKFEQLVDLLQRANKLPFGDVGRFALSLEFMPIRAELTTFMQEWEGRHVT